MGPLADAFVYLLAAVIAVPLANRLGLGSVLGYLLAGIAIGPSVLGFVGDESEDVKHFAEFGVVMMLFLVGLELQPRMLWSMRQRLLGLGGMQVLGSTALLFGAGLALGLGARSSLAIGMTLALSSTAIVLQTLNEKGWMKSPAGQSSFSVLLFQDIAVIPMLALLPLLAVHAVDGGDAGSHGGHEHGGAGLLDGLPGYLRTLALLAVMSSIVVVGRFLTRPVFRFIAAAKLREVFTATALLLVIGVALLMTRIGLSPALGTFLAGVVLSGSEYRHELESDIEPFKGLLLGLFFISVGAGIDFGLLFGEPVTIFGLAFGVMAIKLGVLLLVGRSFRLGGAEILLFALGLSQAGEFAFVLFAFARGNGILDQDLAQTLTLVVAVTMLLTPLAFIAYERIVARCPEEPDSDRAPDAIDERGTAIVAGIGRFGLVVSQLLTTSGFRVVVLEHNEKLIDVLRRVGLQSYYGDATRPDLLHAAGIHEASLFVAGIDDREKQTLLVEHVARHHPHCRIIARATDRHHVYELENAGAHVVEREVFESALEAGRAALVELGMHPFKAERQVRTFRRHDRAALDALRDRWNASGMDNDYLDAARKHVEDTYEVMRNERFSDRHDSTERGWTPPPRGEAVR